MPHLFSAKDPSFKSLLRRSVCFTLGLICLLILVLVLVLRASEEQSHIVDQAHSVIDRINDIQAVILGSEVGLREYETTRDRRLASRFFDLKQTVPSMLDRLDTLLENDRTQSARLGQIRRVFEQWWAINDQLLTPKPKLPRSTLNLSDGLKMDELLGNIQEFSNTEQSLLGIDLANRRTSTQVLLLVLGSGALLIGVLVSWQTIRSVKRLSALYEETVATVQEQTQELQASRDELDRRVEERTAQLNAANRELEVFSYSAAHDLRSPLRWIVQTNKLFVMDYGETVPPEGLQELEKVNAAAVRLSGLIDSLLEMARLGKAEVRKSRLDLTAICRQLEEELRRRDFAPVEVEIQPDMLLEGDPVLISVLMQNLMENAYKFCEQGGEGKVWVGTEDREGERVYFVRDNGVGFDSVYAGKIFQPFERLHRNEEFAGTGMGLANAKRIIERHGGRIWAEGRPGAGACFFFTVG